MTEHLRRFAAEEGVLFIGKAQERASVFRTQKRCSPRSGRTYPWIVKSTAMVNHYYIYAVDRDFGPFSLKFCSYFPYNASCASMAMNTPSVSSAGRRSATRLSTTACSAVPIPPGCNICDELSAEKIDGLLRKWLRRLPHPFTTADRQAGYRYDVSILQAEFSLTQVLDRPVHGRIFFEQVIGENLDLGRPEQVQLIFDRRITRRTPGRMRTRILTQGVTPSLHVYYKNTRIKQYHKEQRALRTETTINNSYDFGVGKRLHNLAKLRAIGFAANRRLLEVERLSFDCILAEDTFRHIKRPGRAGRPTRLRTALCRSSHPPLWHALILFRLLPTGFRRANLGPYLAELSGRDPQTLGPGAITYQLRRLRLHGMIERLPNSYSYRVTQTNESLRAPCGRAGSVERTRLTRCTRRGSGVGLGGFYRRG